MNISVNNFSGLDSVNLVLAEKKVTFKVCVLILYLMMFTLLKQPMIT